MSKPKYKIGQKVYIKKEGLIPKDNGRTAKACNYQFIIRDVQYSLKKYIYWPKIENHKNHWGFYEDQLYDAHDPCNCHPEKEWGASCLDCILHLYP